MGAPPPRRPPPLLLRRDAAAATPPPRRRRPNRPRSTQVARRRDVEFKGRWSSFLSHSTRRVPVGAACTYPCIPCGLSAWKAKLSIEKNGKPTRPTSVLSKSKRLGSSSQKRKIKKIRAVGFEPTPPKRLVPETSALDHSARPAWLRFYDTDRTRTCDPDGN